MADEEESVIGTPLGTPDKPAGAAKEGEASAESKGEPKKGIKAIPQILKKMLSKFRKRLHKNALVAAVLNAVFWGSGYFYNGKRRLFGIMLMGTEILMFIWLYFNPTLRIMDYMTSPLLMVAAVLFFFSLAFDAYKDAREEEEEEAAKPQ